MSPAEFAEQHGDKTMYDVFGGPGWVIYHGNALDVLPTLPHKFGALVTDPPYAIAGGNTNGRTSGADVQFWRHWWRDVWRATAERMHDDGCGFVFSDWRMIAALVDASTDGRDVQRGKSWRVSQGLVWDRESIGMGAPFRSGYEMIGFARGPKWKQDPTIIPRNLPAVIKHRWPYGRHEHHGAQKPVELLEQLIGWTRGPVLDPFVGSGSTILAALRQGRTVVGIERDPETFALAVERIKSATAQGDLL